MKEYRSLLSSKIAFITVLLLLSFTHCYDMCSPIELGDYSYDISTLASQTIGIAGGTGHTNFYNCQPQNCNASSIPSPTS
jgi:hypothetical protein